MRELSSVLRQHAFHLLLLVVALVLFCKPMFLAAESESASRVLLELFVPWGLVVVVLFLIARASDEPAPPQDTSGDLEQD